MLLLYLDYSSHQNVLYRFDPPPGVTCFAPPLVPTSPVTPPSRVTMMTYDGIPPPAMANLSSMPSPFRSYTGLPVR